MNNTTDLTGLTDVTSQAELDQLDQALSAVVGYPPGERGGSDTWGRLLALRRIADRIQSEIVTLAGWVSCHGVVEAREGLPLETALGLLGQMTVSDRKMLLLAADVLTAMPATKGAFRDGRLSWSQVRSIVCAVKKLNRDERGQVDQAIHTWLEQDRRHVDAQTLVAEVDDFVDRLHPVDLERRQKKAYERRFLSIQLALDGSSSWYGQYDPVSTALMLEALDTQTSRNQKSPTADNGDADTDEESLPAGEGLPADGLAGTEGESLLADDDDEPVWKRRGRQRAQALTDICETFLAGGDHGPARPTMLLTAQAETITGESDCPGRLLWQLPDGPIQLSAQQVRELSCHADTQIILKDGTTIVGLVSSKARTPEHIRQMVTVRDQHCRAPGCRRPVTVIHHVEYPNGATRLTRQVGLCRGDHYRVHHDGWTLTMTDDGTCTWTYGTRSYTTHPHDHRHLQPPDTDTPDVHRTGDRQRTIRPGSGRPPDTRPPGSADRTPSRSSPGSSRPGRRLPDDERHERLERVKRKLAARAGSSDPPDNLPF